MQKPNGIQNLGPLWRGFGSYTWTEKLELLRRIINFGVRQRHCPALDWVIELPKQDPNSERIEVLTPEQFQNLQQVWESHPDRQLSHLLQFIGWTGSRPSEALKLLWKDVDFGRRNYTKRDTKSGQTLLQPMNEVETPDFICI